MANAAERILNFNTCSHLLLRPIRVWISNTIVRPRYLLGRRLHLGVQMLYAVDPALFFKRQRMFQRFSNTLSNRLRSAVSLVTQTIKIP